MSFSVTCPYCGTSFTFRSEEKKQAWVAAGKKDPLHPACIKAKKEGSGGDVIGERNVLLAAARMALAALKELNKPGLDYCDAMKRLKEAIARAEREV